MPVFVLKCPSCGELDERVLSYDELTEGLDKESILCKNDGTPLKRSFKDEAVKNTFHPSHSLKDAQRRLADRWDKAERGLI